jgi:hypothetical protein
MRNRHHWLRVGHDLYQRKRSPSGPAAYAEASRNGEAMDASASAVPARRFTPDWDLVIAGRDMFLDPWLAGPVRGRRVDVDLTDMACAGSRGARRRRPRPPGR